MQMGRWFGFRERYLDLCRIFTTEQLKNWYRHIAIASHELLQEFSEMASQNSTPRDFGLKIRSHHQLMVTNRTKLGKRGEKIEGRSEGGEEG